MAIIRRLVCCVWICAWVTCPSTVAANPAAFDSLPPADLIKRFEESWDDSKWNQSFRGIDGYMRHIDDDGWQTRMLVFRALIRHGQSAVPTLIKALDSKYEPTRILAAQTIGYLDADVPSGPLWKAASSDPTKAVRLYAIDSLGMLGHLDLKWDSLLEVERDRDVRRHIAYAKERTTRLEPEIRNSVIDWDPNRLNTAEVGKLAPDFTLTSAHGEQVRLADYRGKQAVVLVFIYGDT